MTQTEYADAVIVGTTINFGLWERVKVLFGARLHLHIVTPTEHLPGKLGTTDIRITDSGWWSNMRAQGASISGGEYEEADTPPGRERE